MSGDAHFNFVKNCAKVIKESGDPEQQPFLMVSNRWIASIYNRESAAFASLLLAL